MNPFVDLQARGIAQQANTTLSSLQQFYSLTNAFNLVIEAFTATASQTVFTLTSGTYDTTKAVFAFVGGAIQTATGVAGDNFTRTSSSSFTMSEGVAEGTIVIFIGQIQNDFNNNFVTVATNKTLALTDAASVQNVTAAATITVPLNADVAFKIGTEIIIKSKTASEVAIAATAGVTINSISGYLKLNGQHSGATLKKEGTNEWWLIGNLKA